MTPFGAPLPTAARFAVVVAWLLGSSFALATEPPVDVWVDDTPRLATDALRDPAAATFVLEASELDRPGRTMADALAAVPGIEVTRSGAGADLSTASLRGATSAQTPIHLAGIRLNDDLTGTVDLSSLPVWVLRRVEVERGVAPVSADRLGIGGAIFLEPEIPSRTSGRLSFGSGSFRRREVRGALSIGGPSAAVLVAVRAEDARDDFEFRDDRGTAFDPQDDVLARRVNSDHSGADAWALGRWSAGRHRVRTLAHALVRESGAPGLQLLPARDARARLARGIGGLAGEHETPLGVVEWAMDGLLTRYHLDDASRELGGARSVDNSGERLRQRVRVHRALTDRIAVSVGLAQELQALRVEQDRMTTNARRQLLHADTEFRLAVAHRGTLLASVALDCHTTTSTGVSEPCGIFAPSGRVGARLPLADSVAVIANVARYLREPTLGELFGISSALRGNDALQPETGISVDVGAVAGRRKGPHAGYVQVDTYLRFSDRLIAFQRSSLGAVRPYNVGAARTLGVEVALGGHIVGWLHGALGATWLDPRDTTPDRQVARDLLPFRSRFVIAPSLELRVPAVRSVGIDGGGATVRYLHRGSRVADPAGLVVLPRQDQLDVEFDLAFRAGVAVRARVANLSNQQTFDLVGYPLPGRNAHATVEVRW